MAAGASAGNPAAGQAASWEDGQLCQLLHSPAYDLFPNSAVFESDFVQVSPAPAPLGSTFPEGSLVAGGQELESTSCTKGLPRSFRVPGGQCPVQAVTNPNPPPFP